MLDGVPCGEHFHSLIPRCHQIPEGRLRQTPRKRVTRQLCGRGTHLLEHLKRPVVQHPPARLPGIGVGHLPYLLVREGVGGARVHEQLSRSTTNLLPQEVALDELVQAPQAFCLPQSRHPHQRIKAETSLQDGPSPQQLGGHGRKTREARADHLPHTCRQQLPQVVAGPQCRAYLHHSLLPGRAAPYYERLLFEEGLERLHEVEGLPPCLQSEPFPEDLSPGASPPFETPCSSRASAGGGFRSVL